MKEKIVSVQQIVSAGDSWESFESQESRGMTRDSDKIKNYDRALLDNASRNFR